MNSEPHCQPIPLMNLEQVAKEAGERFPDAKFLALGQTVFWDEPMKASLAIQANRHGIGFVAGVHDTDYFAKMSSLAKGKSGFKALPHNDGSTKGLWSAAAEFSMLFGSETVITKEYLLRNGLKFDRLSQKRQGFLEQATEAWGWKGVVSLSENPPTTSETRMSELAEELCDTMEWAMDSSVALIGGDQKQKALEVRNRIQTQFCLYADEYGATLDQVYRNLLPEMYSLVANQPLDLELTQTSQLLKFNRATCQLPRFEFLRLFVESLTRSASCRAYNHAIADTHGVYELSKFGTGAIPFDLVVPGKGRGTIRIGNRGVVINTPDPIFISLKKPIERLEELAELIENRLGAEVAIVGKAVTLIGLLGREFIFAFHEGASGYVGASRKLFDLLQFEVLPILRIRYHIWDSLSEVCNWFVLPPEFRRPFGTDEICGPTFASRWSAVGDEQRQKLHELSLIRKPYQLLQFIQREVGAAWDRQIQEYEVIQQELASMTQRYESLDSQRRSLYQVIRSLRKQDQEKQIELGNHFRTTIFDRIPKPAAASKRIQLMKELEQIRVEKSSAKARQKELGKEMQQMVHAERVESLQTRRAEIELEAELKRLAMIREAKITSDGLANANRRPSAWWIPMVSPDGRWFQKIAETAECWWEPMNSKMPEMSLVGSEY